MLLSIIAFIVMIVILVFVHELGHFLAAKISGMRVDTFSIGFGNRLFGWNKQLGFTFGNLPEDFKGEGDTDYRLCAIPLGGYVKIAGMIDETFDTKHLKEEPKEYEFRSKPTYKKLFVITAGVIMNLILAVAIFSLSNYIDGKTDFADTTIGEIPESSFPYQAGFRSNDKIIEVNNKPIDTWTELNIAVLAQNVGETYKVKLERQGKVQSVTINGKVFTEAPPESLFLPLSNTGVSVMGVMENSPALEAGLEPGDVIETINGNRIKKADDVKEIVNANSSNELNFTVIRNFRSDNRDTLSIAITPSIEGLIGISMNENFYKGTPVRDSYSLAGTFQAGFNDVARYITLTYQMFGKMFEGKVKFENSFAGPVKMAKMAGNSARSGLLSYLNLIALLSLSLAVINIMPFPVLDGGHFLIILLEGIARRELPVKIKLYIQNIGFFILMALMIFIIYKDVVSL